MIMVFKIYALLIIKSTFLMSSEEKNSTLHNNLPNHHTCPADIILVGRKLLQELLSRLICSS